MISKENQPVVISDEHYRLLYETMLQGVVHLDARGYILSMNPAAERILGKTLEEFRGETPENNRDKPLIREDGSILPGAEHPALLALHSRKMVRDVVMGGYNPRKKEYIWFNVTAVPLFRPGETEPYQVYSIFDDITGRKTLEAELRAAIDARDEFLSIASHELRTPLTTLHLHLQLLRKVAGKKDPELERQTVPMLERAISASSRLAGLLDELLDLTRIRAGKLKLTKQRFDLRGLAAEIVDRMSEDIKRSGSTVQLACPEEIVGSWDRIRIDQVVTNLLSNALKYGEGRPIEIGLEGDTKENAASILVRDHGSGIPKQLQYKIFRRFERGFSSAQVAGLGLGLYIVRQIVEAHNGSIRVESDVGQGSLFAVRLPLG